MLKKLIISAVLVYATASVAQTTPCSNLTLGTNGALNGFVPSPNDAWHQDISTAPIDPLSAKIISTSGDLLGAHLHPDFSSIANGDYGIPYTVVDSNTTASIALPITLYPTESDIMVVPIPSVLPVEQNTGECPTDTHDRHALIIDRNKCVVYELYQAAHCTNGWSASDIAVWDLTKAQSRPYGYTSADAAGLSIFSGLIRYDEIVAGSINHAIRFTAQHTRNNPNHGYFTFPATHAAGNSSIVDNVEGMRIRLKANFDVSGFSTTNQIILNAMKKYGMILADNGSNMFFQGTPDARWNDNDLNLLKNVPSTAFDVIQMGPVYDSATAPAGPVPVITSFTASASTVASGTDVTLTPVVTGADYMYIDTLGPIRGPITFPATSTGTYKLTARNIYGTATSAAVTVTVTGGQQTPVLTFVAVPTQTFGAAPFTVNASSASPGAVTYTIASGPATVSGNTVTLTAIGTVIVKASQAAAPHFNATTTTTSFTVKAGTPPLAFVGIADLLYTAAPITLVTTTPSSGSISYAVVSGPATISSGNKLTFTGLGKISLQANQAAAGNYLAGTAMTSFHVLAGDPNLTVAPVPDMPLGAAPFPITATSLSTGAITYTVMAGKATLAGNVVTVNALGPVSIRARQVASGNYEDVSVTITFNVTGALTAPALKFVGIPAQTFGATPFAVSASSASTGAITYSISSGPATIAGSTVTLTGVGPVVVTASQAATATYSADTATASFTVNSATPALAFAAIATQVYGVAPVAISATSQSTGAVTYAVISGSATLAGNVLSVTGVGTVSVQATQAATANYTAATATTSFTVNPATPSLVLASIGTQVYGVAPFATSATSQSAGAVTYAVTSGPATLAGNVLNVTGIGTVSVQATQAATANYTAATATTSFTVTAGDPGLAFVPILPQLLGVTPLLVSTTSKSAGAVSYSVTGGSAILIGNLLTITGPGVVSLQATQAASGNYAAATATTNFSVNAPVSSLTLAAIPDQTYGNAPIVLNASSPSPAPITLSISGGYAVLSGNTLTIAKVGLVTVQARQAASGTYPAATVFASFNVVAESVPLTFRTIPAQSFSTSAPFAVRATSVSSGAVSYSVVSGPATISGSTVTLTGPGTVTLQASQLASGNYAASTGTVSFTVAP